MLQISDKPKRTLKYFFALALGVAIVRPEWVIECCRQAKVLPVAPYLLAAGYSLEHRAVPRGKTSERPIPLTDRVLYNVQLHLAGGASGTGHGASESERSEWESLVKAAGAIVVSLTKSQCVVSLGNLKRSLVEKARALDLPIVSTEWVVQCLIHQRRFRTNAHAQFDFLQTEQTAE